MSDDEQNPDDGLDQDSLDSAMDNDSIDDIFGDEIDGTEIVNQSIDSNYEPGEAMAEDVTAIYDIPVQISAVLGRSTMQVSQLLKLGRGAVVELDRKVGEAIDIYVNNRLVARGEVVVVEDKLGVTMTEIVKSDRN